MTTVGRSIPHVTNEMRADCHVYVHWMAHILHHFTSSKEEYKNKGEQ